MNLRFQAPPHTSSISTPNGDVQVGEGGVIQLDDDASEVTRDYLRRAGCTPLADEAPAAKTVAKVAPAPESPAPDAD